MALVVDSMAVVGLEGAIWHTLAVSTGPWLCWWEPPLVTAVGLEDRESSLELVMSSSRLISFRLMGGGVYCKYTLPNSVHIYYSYVLLHNQKGKREWEGGGAWSGAEQSSRLVAPRRRLSSVLPVRFPTSNRRCAGCRAASRQVIFPTFNEGIWERHRQG